LIFFSTLPSSTEGVSFKGCNQTELPEGYTAVRLTSDLVRFGEEAINKDDSCYVMKCWRGGWKKSLINYRCCSHENIAIKDGDTIFSDIEGQEKGCSQIELSCRWNDGAGALETVKEVLMNSKCCDHEDYTIHPGKPIFDKERCAKIYCTKKDQGEVGKGYHVHIEKRFNDSCGCCLWKGELVRNGDKIVSELKRGLRCLEGHIYNLEEVDEDGNSMVDFEWRNRDFPVEDIEFYKMIDCSDQCLWRDHELGRSVTRVNGVNIWIHEVTDFLTKIINDNDVKNLAVILEQGVSANVEKFAHLVTLALPLKNETVSFITHFAHQEDSYEEVDEPKCTVIESYSFDPFQRQPVQRCSFNQRWNKLPSNEDQTKTKAENSKRNKEGVIWRKSGLAGAVQLTMSSIESDQVELANDPSKTLIVIFTGCQGQMSQDNQILSDEVYQLTTVKGYNLAALNVGPTEPGNKAKLNFYAKAHNMVHLQLMEYEASEEFASTIINATDCLTRCKCDKPVEEALVTTELELTDCRGMFRKHYFDQIRQEKQTVKGSFTCEELKSNPTLCMNQNLALRKSAFNSQPQENSEPPEVFEMETRTGQSILKTTSKSAVPTTDQNTTPFQSLESAGSLDYE